MNFITRHDHLSNGYQCINPALNNGYTARLTTNGFLSTHKLNLSNQFLWLKTFHQGSRVSTITDWLQIKIGGDEEIHKKTQNNELNRIKTTKYTIFTFLPQNLLEQFRRIANFYFLVVTIISLLIDSPVSPMTTLLPLVCVIAVTMAKQGYEDYLRYKTDNIINHSLVTVIRNGVEENIESQNIIPGDLVLAEKDCDVPCDLIILRSSDPHGKCFITTANLDGETNLKTLMVPRDLPKVEISQLNKIGIIECESPTTDLYSFNGKIELSGFDQSIIPLSTENILLRGSRIRNTDFIIGCAIYTGMNTKLQRNSRATRNKVSSSEEFINRFIVFILVAMIIIVTFLYFLKRYEEEVTIPKMPYIGLTINNYSVKQFLEDYLSFMIIFNYLIPISLYVTIELNRIIGGFLMEWDLKLYDEETNEHCIVNTSNLNEDLGQVNILFSDKTGTLTKNEMIFQQCSIAGNKFMYKKTRLENIDTGALIDLQSFNAEQKIFFQALCICHSVQIARDANISLSSSETNPIGNDSSNIHSFSDITEESHGASMESAIDLTPSLSPDVSNDITNQSEAKSSLIKTAKPISRIKPLVTKRSPNFTRQQYPLENKQSSRTLFPTSLLNINDGRPMSLAYQRSTSEIELETISEDQDKVGHRRSLSYGAPNLQTSPNVGRSGVSLRPSSSAGSRASRESYAAPSFRRAPTILYRHESLRRKEKIQEFVQTLNYQASSPDEKALVEACANLGLVYTGDDDEILKIRLVAPHVNYSRPLTFANNSSLSFNRLHVLEFTSDRKRMSVIVSDSTGKKWIYTKGAESYVFPLCKFIPNNIMEVTNAHITDFARLGLRTLAVARKIVTEDEFNDFKKCLNEANSSLENRKALLAQCYSKIEKDLELLGATAVEDALQDNVANTLISLREAGIKIWVLTGDKVETALNIALSCGHIPKTASKYFIVNCQRKEDMQTHLNCLEHEIGSGVGMEWALLIDGESLVIALTEEPVKFRDVSMKCVAVLCCRLSPLQKSEVVALIKSSTENLRTAAIGDGANDVSMIQEAHVGIGIMGKEGRQAARCADFALAKFCMLKRLLLVHGHYHSSRLSLLVLYFFYKNIVFMGNMFFFQFFTLFSSSSIYDSLFLTCFNVFYTSAPIFVISLTEKPHSEDKLMNSPELYKQNINNKKLRWSFFLRWVCYGVYHSCAMFFFAYAMFIQNDALLNVGQIAEFSCFGVLLTQMVVIVVNLKLWMETKYMSYLFIFSVVVSIAFFVITTVIYNVINFNFDTDIYWAYNKILTSIPLWMYVILTTVSCLLPDYTFSIGSKALNLPKRYVFPGSELRRRMNENQKLQSTAV